MGFSIPLPAEAVQLSKVGSQGWPHVEDNAGGCRQERGGASGIQGGLPAMWWLGS